MYISYFSKVMTQVQVLIYFFAISLRRHKNIDYNTLFWPTCHIDEQNKTLMYIQNVENENSYSYFVVFYIRQPF